MGEKGPRPSGQWNSLAKNLTKNGKKSTANLVMGKRAVLIYFSAHWCPDCRGFTPILAKAYRMYTAVMKDVEVVFVSKDHDDKAFNEYFREMPWTAIPFQSAKIRELSNKYRVDWIPQLVVLDADGDEVTNNG